MTQKNATAYNGRGLTCNNLGKYQQAIEDFNQALLLNPNYVDAYMNRGIAYVNLNQLENACTDFQKACELGDCENKRLAKERGICK